MLRVLQVVTYMGRGGLETMLMNYYRHMDRSQIQFDFLTHRQDRYDYDDEIEQLGGKICRLPVLNPFSGNYKRALSYVFETHPEYQIVHVHQDCLSSVVLKIAKERGVKVRIAHSHSSSQDKNLKYPIKLFYQRFIPRYATDCMACSREAGDWMFRGAPYQILNNAIDATSYVFDANKRSEMRQGLGIGADVLCLGHVGRFSEVKNHAFLLKILKQTLQFADAKLLLVGNGELKNAIEEQARTEQISDKVIFTGVRADVADLMQTMDVFVLPSLYEGLPLTMVEAQASGLPCLISDKVPIECKLTEHVYQLPLSERANVWARQAAEIARLPREDTLRQIQDAGFDIEDSARKLAEYYVSRAESAL